MCEFEKVSSEFTHFSYVAYLRIAGISDRMKNILTFLSYILDILLLMAYSALARDGRDSVRKEETPWKTQHVQRVLRAEYCSQ